MPFYPKRNDVMQQSVKPKEILTFTTHHQSMGQKSIRMVDLLGQYNRLKNELDEAVLQCLSSGNYIQGEAVRLFEKELSAFTQSPAVISCANGTDALQLACMAADLKARDKVIVPAFTYIATVEILALMGIEPVYADVDERTFNLTKENIEAVYTDEIKAVIVVHLYGQSADMESIVAFCSEKNIILIEDNAQSIGSEYTFSSGKKMQTGTMGTMGTTSFFPSKNLGAAGDGGALFTADEVFAQKLKMLANHGQSAKYVHDLVGINSRLDTLQAAILRVKLRHLNDFICRRQNAAAVYDQLLKDCHEVTIPFRQQNATHVFHQYTIKVEAEKRNNLETYLANAGIPTGIYYSMPVYEQKAYLLNNSLSIKCKVSERLSSQVLSLPMHTELTLEEQSYIAAQILNFFKNE